MTHMPLRIEVSTTREAESLRSYLQPFDVETTALDGHVEIRVELVEVNPERRVVNALNAIDAWLSASGVNAVKVHLDGSTYTLHAPPAPEAA